MTTTMKDAFGISLDEALELRRRALLGELSQVEASQLGRLQSQNESISIERANGILERMRRRVLGRV